MNGRISSSIRTQSYRAGLRQRGLRPVQVCVPDIRAPGFAAEIDRHCQAINAADQQDGLMDWVESVSLFDEEAE